MLNSYEGVIQFGNDNGNNDGNDNFDNEYFMPSIK